MDQASLATILKLGTKAPSGSNSQPWKFEWKDNTLSILSLPEKDHKFFNYNNRGTWVAHGALLENILIASSHLGFSASYVLFPDSAKPNLTFTIRFTPAKQGPEPLFDYINQRATNRKPYQPGLTLAEKNALIESAALIEGVRVVIIDDEERLAVVGQASSINERVMLENEKLHELFFKEIVWTEQEEKEKKTGLYLKTMELPGGAQLALRLFKNWRVAKILNSLGASQAIAAGNAASYAKTGGMAAFLVQNDDRAFINVGRAMQRVWLQATALGLSAHPLAGTIFMWQQAFLGNTEILTEPHRALVRKAYAETAAAFSADQTIVGFILRLGHDGKPSAYSSRFPLEQIFSEKQKNSL